MVAYVTKRRETRESRGGLCLDEDEANFFFRQLIWAVQFCHNNHVAHRCVGAVWVTRGPGGRDTMIRTMKKRTGPANTWVSNRGPCERWAGCSG